MSPQEIDILNGVDLQGKVIVGAGRQASSGFDELWCAHHTHAHVNFKQQMKL